MLLIVNLSPVTSPITEQVKSSQISIIAGTFSATVEITIRECASPNSSASALCSKSISITAPFKELLGKKQDSARATASPPSEQS